MCSDFDGTRVSLKHSTSLLRALHHSQHLQLQEERVEVGSGLSYLVLGGFDLSCFRWKA